MISVRTFISNNLVFSDDGWILLDKNTYTTWVFGSTQANVPVNPE